MAAAIVTTIYPPIYPPTPPPITAAARGGNHLNINHPSLSLLSIQRKELPNDCVKQVHLLQAFYAAIGGPSPVLGAFPGPNPGADAGMLPYPGPNPGSSLGSDADEKVFASIVSEGLCGLFVRLSKGDFYPYKSHQTNNNNHNHNNNIGSRAGLGPGPAPRPTSANTSGYPLPTAPPLTFNDASLDVLDHLLVINGRCLEFLSGTEKLKAQKAEYSKLGYTLFQPLLWSIQYVRGCIAR